MLYKFEPRTFCNLNGPFRCPVCNGRGTVSSNFYSDRHQSTSYTYEVQCRSCNGKGVLWR